MSYQALYRVWRPQAFAEVVGQEHVTKTLQNALLEQNFSHAYLFSGPRGTGKTSIAKILAKAVNCQEAPTAEPCNSCAACTGITQGRIVDVVEIDAASNNGVDEIRDIRDKVKFAPTEVKMKVYIIDEVHMLTQGAFNALLKTLEEPPPHVMFILATTEPHKIPLTIISRCQRFDFKKIPKKSMVQRLLHICQEENIRIQEEAMHVLMQVAEGGMRDALSLLDQAFAFAEDEVTLEDVLAVTGAVSQQALSELADCILHGKLEEAIRYLDELMDQGKEPIRLVEDLIYYFRDVLLYQSAPHLEEVLERVRVTEEFKSKADQYAKERLFSAIQRLSMAQNEMKFTNHPRIFLEVACIQLTQGKPAQQSAATEATGELTETQLQDIQHRIAQLEEQVRLLGQGQPAAQAHEPTTKKPVSTKTRANHAGPQVSQHKIKEMLKTASKAQLVQLTGQWSQILEDIKKTKITVHAWLMDGEPVACSSNFFIVAFNNAIHRETTEKETHRQLIEEVVSRYLQTPAKLVTIMYNEWSEIKEQFIREQKGEKSEGHEQEKDPFYEEAVKLVGEDLVEVVNKE